MDASSRGSLTALAQQGLFADEAFLKSALSQPLAPYSPLTSLQLPNLPQILAPALVRPVHPVRPPLPSSLPRLLPLHPTSRCDPLTEAQVPPMPTSPRPPPARNVSGGVKESECRAGVGGEAVGALGGVEGGGDGVGCEGLGGTQRRGGGEWTSLWRGWGADELGVRAGSAGLSTSWIRQSKWSLRRTLYVRPARERPVGSPSSGGSSRGAYERLSGDDLRTWNGARSDKRSWRTVLQYVIVLETQPRPRLNIFEVGVGLRGLLCALRSFLCTTNDVDSKQLHPHSRSLPLLPTLLQLLQLRLHLPDPLHLRRHHLLPPHLLSSAPPSPLQSRLTGSVPSTPIKSLA